MGGWMGGSETNLNPSDFGLPKMKLSSGEEVDMHVSR